MARFYLATSLQNRGIALDVIRRLRDVGWTTTFDWAARPPVDHHDPAALRRRAQDDIAGVLSADVVVAILPGGVGTHYEIGAAYAKGIPVILWAPGGLQAAHRTQRPTLWGRVYRTLPAWLQRRVSPPAGDYPCVFHHLVDEVETRAQVEHLISRCVLWESDPARIKWIATLGGMPASADLTAS